MCEEITKAVPIIDHLQVYFQRNSVCASMCAGTPCTTFPLSIVRILVPSHSSSFDLRFLFEGQSRTRNSYPRKGATETTDREGEGAEYKECQGFIETRIQTLIGHRQ